MKQTIHLILYIVVMAISMVSCQQTQVSQVSNPEELKELYQQVLTVADESPDSAMLMIDSLRRGGTLPDYRCDFLCAKIFAQSSDSLRLDSAIIIGERLMALDVVEEDSAIRQDVLEVLINACRMHRDDEQTIHWSMQLIDLCRQQGEETEALRTEAEVGLVLSFLGKTDEGLAKIDNVIHQLSGKRKFNEMDASIIALRRKENMLDNEGRYDEIPLVAQEILSLLADYEQHPDEFHDCSYREVTEEQRPGYIEFYRSKAYLYMAHAYASLNEKGKAREYLRLFEQCAFANTLKGRAEIAPIWCQLGEYDKMSAAYDEFEVRLREQGDTVNVAFANILRDRAKAAQAQGRYAESLRLHEQYEILNNILNDRLLQGKAHLYAARFHAQEQQQEIERQAAKVRQSQLLNTLLAVILFGVITLSLLFYVQKRKMKQKNQILASQIQEAMTYRELYLEQRRLTAQTADSDVKPETLDDNQLFAYLSDLIEREQLYLDSDFGRQTLIDRTGLTKERIGAAFARGSDHDRMTSYVRNLRLEFAVQLLTDCPDLSITQVSAASGFTIPETFTRYFRARYGMSPTVFRRSKG